MTCFNFISNNRNKRVLTISNSVIEVKNTTSLYAWLFNGDNLVLNAAGSTILMNGTGNIDWFFHGGAPAVYYNVVLQNSNWNNFSGPYCFFNKVEFKGPFIQSDAFANIDSLILYKGMLFNDLDNAKCLNTDVIKYLELKSGLAKIKGGCKIGKALFFGNSIIQGDNSFDTVYFQPGTQHTLGSGNTQLINGTIQANGSCTQPIFIESTVGGTQAILRKISGNISMNYVSLQDINATGGAIFNTNNSADLGNNSGFGFGPANSIKL